MDIIFERDILAKGLNRAEEPELDPKNRHRSQVTFFLDILKAMKY